MKKTDTGIQFLCCFMIASLFPISAIQGTNIILDSFVKTFPPLRCVKVRVLFISNYFLFYVIM
ncbi:hypothetical protein HDV63DRAFT_156195 [Trichoderma sp. SZMC 28014]